MNEWVRLTSSDGYHYLVRKKVAMCSGTLKNTLNVEGELSNLTKTFLWGGRALNLYFCVDQATSRKPFPIPALSTNGTGRPSAPHTSICP